MDPRALPPELALAVGGAGLALAAYLVLRSWWRERARRRDRRQVQARALAGEDRAMELLSGLGYAVIGRQVTTHYAIEVDGAPRAIELRADYLVERSERRWIAEVKTGRVAPSVHAPATRRQLLEYRIAFDVDGVLLVDAEAGRVHEVVFPLESSAPRSQGRGAWIVLATALAIGLLLLRLFV